MALTELSFGSSFTKSQNGLASIGEFLQTVEFCWQSLLSRPSQQRPQAISDVVLAAGTTGVVWHSVDRICSMWCRPNRASASWPLLT